MPTEKRKPTWTLCINENPPHEKPKWREIGAAWDTQGGNLFVKLNEGERLSGTAMLFPYREKRESRYAARTWRPASGPYGPTPPTASDPTLTRESDYMERKRQERAARPPTVRNPPPPAAPPGAMDPDPPSPEWL